MVFARMALTVFVGCRLSVVGQRGLGALLVAGVATVLARRIVLVIAEVVGGLALQGRLRQPFGQLLKRPGLARRV